MNASTPRAYTISDVDSRPAERALPRPLAPVGDKAVDLDFAGGRLSADAGLVLLQDPDEPRGLTRALAAVLSDPRDPRRVNCTRHDLLKQRVFQIAVGYEDANDAHTLRHDPLFKLLLGRLPDSGAPLASQPTISRFENRVSRPELYRMARVLVDQCLASYSHPPKVIVLDFDDTEDPAHGAQEQVRYDGYYGGYCCLPRHLYEGLSGRLITAIFKAKRFTGTQMLAVLQRLLTHRRTTWPETLLIVRGDSHFAYPEVMPWIEAQINLHYVTGLTSNKVLHALACPVVEQAQRAYERDRVKMTRFHSTRYQAGTWSCPRRVVSKVEVSDQGVNTRFVVTDLAQAHAKGLYRQIDCARGQMENEIKDHNLSLKSDRPSCHRFEAHQCRWLLHSAAYVFLDTLRREVFKTTAGACATMETIQLRLCTLGARVQESTERITIALPSSCPVAPILRRSLALFARLRVTSRALRAWIASLVQGCSGCVVRLCRLPGQRAPARGLEADCKDARVP